MSHDYYTRGYERGRLDEKEQQSRLLQESLLEREPESALLVSTLSELETHLNDQVQRIELELSKDMTNFQEKLRQTVTSNIQRIVNNRLSPSWRTWDIVCLILLIIALLSVISVYVLLFLGIIPSH